MLNNGWLSTDDSMQQKKYGAEWNKKKWEQNTATTTTAASAK